MKELTKKNLKCNLNENEYLLTCITEECSEVIKAICKAFRFGIDHEYPSIGMTNKENIEHEIHDLLAVIYMLQEKKFFPNLIDQVKVESKVSKVEKYMKAVVK